MKQVQVQVSIAGTESPVKMADRHSPWFTDCSISTRHLYRFEMGQSLIRMVLCQQHFATPNCVVRPIAVAIQSYCYNRAVKSMLSHAAYGMGMMMLDTYYRHFLLAAGISAPRIIRMQIMHQQVRFNPQQCLKVAGNVFLVQLSIQVVQVTYVLADKGFFFLGQTDGILDNRSKGKGTAAVLLQVDNLGDKGSRPSVKSLITVIHPDD